MAAISISVVHKGQIFKITANTLSSLRQELEELTSVPPSLQKLLYKGRNLVQEDDVVTLLDLGIKDGVKIQMLSTTPQQLDSMQTAMDESQRRERIMQKRAAQGPVKVRNTRSSDSANLSYRFHSLVPLSHLPEPSTALRVLERLAADPAIQHVMRQHQFSVGILTELAPHEHPNLLGLNVNRGEQIKLRLRTDAYDGFRPYFMFKELNSQLNREVTQFERDKRQGTNHLSGWDGDAYEPSDAEAAAALSRTLGGVAPPVGETPTERRARVLEATMKRLKLEEKELEDSCGTAGPAAS